MLGWIFKKNNAVDGDPAAPSASVPAVPSAAATSEPAMPGVDWPQRLQATEGDATALLALARSAGAPFTVQQAAIDAVTDEAALKRAEHDWRGQDRRLHRLVKQRHLAQVAQREARDQAARLIAAAEALRHESPIPTNRLVELDRGWRALDPARLEEAQVERYTALVAQLTALTREHGDTALKVQRWVQEAHRARAMLGQALTDAAAGPLPRDALAAAAAAARAVVESAPDAAAATAARSALEANLALAQQFGSHLTLLDELIDAPAADAAERIARWDARVPLPDAHLAGLLEQQATAWRSARDADRQGQRVAQRAQNRERQRETAQGLGDTLTAALEQGEAALAEGHLADAHRHLVAIDELLGGAAAPAPLAARIDRLQADYAQLKGWQHWAGGVARDELVLQAEALAAVSQREPALPGVKPSLKLSLKQRAEVIDDMRARWKELDRLGGATSRALWQRFDAALKAAWAPLAEHQAQQRAARTLNLQARNALIDALDAVPLPAVDADAAPDWKAVASALDQLRTEWRRLGPLEHTVPHQARDGLVQRLDAATARLEAPLAEARRSAQAARERLVERARTLADQANAGTAGRDSIDRVRELQAGWQQQARTLPLARPVETALWSAFKAATDAVFHAREATFNARDAQFRAAAAERLALIERLETLDATSPAAELKRALAEADALWQRAAPPPRQDAAALDARWRAAQAHWREHLAGSARRAWQAQCDALAVRLALCDAAEDSADPAAARQQMLAEWPTLAALPPAWTTALAQRLGADAKAGTPASVDALLLKVEMATGLASPAAQEAARRELKLLALKATLEGRQASAAPSPGRLFVELLERANLDAAQRSRMTAIIDGLRRGEPLV